MKLKKPRMGVAQIRKEQQEKKGRRDAQVKCADRPVLTQGEWGEMFILNKGRPAGK